MPQCARAHSVTHVSLCFCCPNALDPDCAGELTGAWVGEFVVVPHPLLNGLLPSCAPCRLASFLY